MKRRKADPAKTGGVDPNLSECKREPLELSARACALDVLLEDEIPFLVGGAYAYAHYTGIYRDTRDLDLFVRKEDADRGIDALEANGFRVERGVHGWLHKAFLGEYLIDLIYSSGSGLGVVDDEWLAHAQEGEILGRHCRIAPVEEILWNKMFVLERERFDGAEINHLLLTCGRDLDWKRVLRRFDRYFEILLGHVMFFRFIYPSHRDCVPDTVMQELLGRTYASVQQGSWSGKVCRGRIVSNYGYRVDVEEWGFEDGRRRDERERRAEDQHAHALAPYE